jgi:hypothetical protein
MNELELVRKEASKEASEEVRKRVKLLTSAMVQPSEKTSMAVVSCLTGACDGSFTGWNSGKVYKTDIYNE